MVIHFPIMRIIVPGNVSMLMSIIMPIVMFDILDNDQGIDASLIYDFDEDAQGEEILDQMEDLGYETHYAILNLSTMYLMMNIYILKIFCLVSLKVFAMTTNGKFGSRAKARVIFD